MQKEICLIHAFTAKESFGLELIEAYRLAAVDLGFTLHFTDIHTLDFDPFIYPGRAAYELESDLKDVIKSIVSSRHLAIFMPVYQAYIPTLSQAFFNKIFQTDSVGRLPAQIWGSHPGLSLKTARIISLLDHYSWMEFKVERTTQYHPLKKSVLEVLDFGKVYTTTIPPYYKHANSDYRDKWLKKIKVLVEKTF